MAIQFLNDIDLNQNEAFHLVLENQLNDTAAGTPVDGQLYYDTTNNVPKFGEAGAWVQFGTGTGSGTVTQVSTTNGAGISASVANSTTTPNITITNSDRGSSQNIFKNVTSDSGTAIADNNNDTLSIVGGTNITTAVVGDVLTITGSSSYVLPQMTSTVRGGAELFSDTVQTVAANAVTTTASRTYGMQLNSANQLVVNVPWSDSNTGLTSVGVTETGNALTITNSPLTSNGNINIAGAGNSTQYIDGALNLVSFPSIPQGDVTGVIPATAVALKGISVASQSGPVPVVGLDIINQTNLTSLADADDFLVYDSSVSTNKRVGFDVIKAAIPNQTITLSGDVSGSGTGSITTTIGADKVLGSMLNNNVISSQTNLSATPDGSDELLISDAGTIKAITVANLSAYAPQGDITNVIAGTFMTGGGSSGSVTLNADGTTAATANKLIARDGSGFGYVVTPTSGDSSTKIATTAFVQASLTGLLEFKGGFDANGGAIVGGGNLTAGAGRVAIAVGDYYVVTGDGDFFGNAATPLTTGDSVICQTAAIAGASVEGDFIVVQSDTDLATLSTVGIGNVNSGTGIGVSYSSGTATVTNSDRGSSQFIYKNFTAGSGGTATANTNNDTLTIAGGTNVSTARSGDTITISSVNTVYSAMTTATLGLGRLRYAVGSTPAANSQSTVASRTYGITKNSSDQLIVNVPWTNTNSGGTVTNVAVTAGYLIDSSVSSPTGSANISLDVDASELVDMTQTFVTGDEFFVLDVSNSGKDQGRRKAAGEIPLSVFSNDLPAGGGGTNANLTVDNSTIQLNSGTTYNGSAARTMSAKTAAVANGGSALATGDQIYDFVVGQLPTVNNSTITLTAGSNITGGGNFTLNQSSNETLTFNVPTSTASALGVVKVAGGAGIDVSYSSGTATVALTSGSGGSFSGTLTSATSGITRSVSGGFTTFDCTVTTLIGAGADGRECMVEVYQASTYKTVFAEVTRDSDEVFVKFKGTIADGLFGVLIRDNSSN